MILDVHVMPAHRHEGCQCTMGVERLVVLDGRVWEVRVPACQTLPPQPSGPMIRWISELCGQPLLTRLQVVHLLRRHHLPGKLLKRMTSCGLDLIPLREVARHTRGLPRQKCHHCGRRFNTRVGPARAAELYRLYGRTYTAVQVLACSVECYVACLQENSEYLKCLKRQLGATRALQKQVQAIKKVCREMKESPCPATGNSPREASPR